MNIIAKTTPEVYTMDITEVPVREGNKGKIKKNKKAKKKSVSAERDEKDNGLETKDAAKMEMSEAASAFPPTFSVSEIKNKQRRHFMFMKVKQEKRKVNISRKQGICH